MNFDVLYDQRWLKGSLPLEAYVLHEDLAVTLYYLRETHGQSMSADNILNQLIPETRCYRIGGKPSTPSNPDLIRPKYSDRALQYMYPGNLWIKPKLSPESYEFGYNGFVAAHDDLNNALTDQSVNVYRWRQGRPELDHVFDAIKNTPEGKEFMKHMLILGAHYNPADIPDAFAALMLRWEQRLHELFSNIVWVDNLALHIHHEICMALELPRSCLDGRWNLMIHIASDDLQARFRDLISQVTQDLNVDVQELRQQRLKVIRGSVNTWFINTSIRRILDKCSITHGQQSIEAYKTLYTHHMTQMLLHLLEDTIKQQLQDHNKHT
jgi:hypothetical protein